MTGGKEERGLVRNQQVVVVLQERGRRERANKRAPSLDCLLKESIRINSTRQPMTNGGEARMYR